MPQRCPRCPCEDRCCPLQGAKESAKVNAAHAKLQAETEAKAARMAERLEDAAVRKAEAYGERVATAQQRSLEATVRLEQATEAVLLRGAIEARREVAAVTKR